MMAISQGGQDFQIASPLLDAEMGFAELPEIEVKVNKAQVIRVSSNTEGTV